MSENDVGFFVNLEKEAAAAKLVHLGNPQTALVTQKIPFCRENRQKGISRSALGLCFVGPLDDDSAVAQTQAAQFEVLPLFQTDGAGHPMEVRGTWRLNRCGNSRPIGGCLHALVGWRWFHGGLVPTEHTQKKRLPLWRGEAAGVVSGDIAGR